MNIIVANDTVAEPDDKQFIDEMNKLLKIFYNTSTKNEKITTCIEILNIIDKFSFIFNMKKYKRFLNVLKDKLYECLQAKTLNGNCLEYYTLKYGDGIITMAEQIINNKK